jgi:hypothetical protein
MKNWITIIFFFTLISGIFSQTKRVGIGTTNPTKLLHIEGDVNSTDNLLYSRVNRVGNSDIRAIEAHSISNPGYGIGGHFTGGYRGVYALNDAGDYNGGGNYGLYAQAIGTTATGTRTALFAEATGGLINLAAKFGSGDVEVSNGVRIGSTSQNGRLYINNNNKAFGSTSSAIRVINNHNGSEATYGMYTTVETSSSADSYGIRAQGNVTGTGDSYGVRALAYANGTGGVAYGLHTQVTDAQGWSLYSLGKNYMSGDLRIGTTTDPYAGEYKVIVDGKILSEEVRIQNSSAWPDYVFQENYNLMPLDQLAQSIEDNGHLPNIPPAKVVESEGIQVGDMQIRMMEKIEELTLYILQLEKRIAEIEKR